MTVDSLRLARAVHLEAEPLDRNSWLVTGGRRAHVISAQLRVCDCVDQAVRHSECKHVLRVRLALGDSELVRALCTLVRLPRRTRRRSLPQLGTAARAARATGGYASSIAERG